MIDTSSWKEFRIGDLFDLSLSNDDIQPKNIVDGDVPLISSGKTNNGVVAYIIDDDATLQNANTITVDMFGKAFYQKDSYYAVSHGRVNILTPKFAITENIGLFMASVIETVSGDKYEFNEMCTGTKLAKDVISLPATSDGQPDWEYMETYMKTVMEESEKSLENLKKADDTKHLIDVSGWKKCRLGDYFDFETGKDMLPTKERDGTFPVVCLGSNNNGIGLYIAENSKHKLYDAGCITIAGWAGGLFAFYQEQKFYVKGRVKIAIPKQPLSKFAGLFMCTMIDSESWKYTYAEKVSGDKLPNTELYLPITSTGEPDWQYMEDYMKSIMDQSEKVIECLNTYRKRKE